MNCNYVHFSLQNVWNLRNIDEYILINNKFKKIQFYIFIAFTVCLNKNVTLQQPYNLRNRINNLCKKSYNKNQTRINNFVASFCSVMLKLCLEIIVLPLVRCAVVSRK